MRAPFFGLYNRIAGYEKFPMLYWYAVWADCNSVMEYMHRDANAPYEIHAGMIGSGDHMNMANASYNWEALLMLAGLAFAVLSLARRLAFPQKSRE